MAHLLVNDYGAKYFSDYWLRSGELYRYLGKSLNENHSSYFRNGQNGILELYLRTTQLGSQGQKNEGRMIPTQREKSPRLVI